MITTREARKGDIEALSAGLRDADRQEIAAFGREPVEALMDGLETSELCYVIVDDDDNPVGIFGVGEHPLDDTNGIIWMLATPGLQKEPMRFLRQTHRYIDMLFEVGNYTKLTNWTDARNTLHHKWILWCGGEFTDRQPIGTAGEEFLHFVIKRD